MYWLYNVDIIHVFVVQCRYNPCIGSRITKNALKNDTANAQIAHSISIKVFDHRKKIEHQYSIALFLLTNNMISSMNSLHRERYDSKES